VPKRSASSEPGYTAGSRLTIRSVAPRTTRSDSCGMPTPARQIMIEFVDDAGDAEPPPLTPGPAHTVPKHGSVEDVDDVLDERLNAGPVRFRRSSAPQRTVHLLPESVLHGLLIRVQ